MKHHLTLIRPYGMLFLGFTPVFSAIVNGEFSFQHLAILYVIGILAHIFGFAQNDYFDLKIDSKSKYVAKRPIVTGKISQKTAMIIFSSSFVLSLILSIVFVFSLYSFLVLLITFFLFTLYNKYSKRFFGMEYVLGAGVFTFGIFGALTVSNNVSSFAIIISAVGFMQWLFSVGISANLKDVEFDTKQGTRTTPSVFGVKAVDKKLLIPNSFWIYAFSLKIIHILIVALPFILGYTSIFIYGLPIPGISFLIISIILLYLTFKILTTPMSKRDNMLINAGLQEGHALLLILVVLLDLFVENISILVFLWLIVLFMVWPLFWLRILYGEKMIPLE